MRVFTQDWYAFVAIATRPFPDEIPYSKSAEAFKNRYTLVASLLTKKWPGGAKFSTAGSTKDAGVLPSASPTPVI